MMFSINGIIVNFMFPHHILSILYKQITEYLNCKNTAV